ncbi:MAG: hypothetical protein HC852_05085 [Acaryochloridaceae cyanobacterium RU_4_10]|nr:hypothetical protein [Acaryochloridaceae cyanobacterium RU_4_10]
MFTRDKFRKIKRLKCFLEEKSQHCQWLFILDTEELNLNSLCLALREDLNEFHEYTEQLKNNGFREFLSSARLENIVENLQKQKFDYTDSDLTLALNFYWKNNAFIDLECIASPSIPRGARHPLAREKRFNWSLR